MEIIGTQIKVTAEFIALGTAFIGLFGAVVGLIKGIREFRKPALLRKTFDWASEAMQNEENDFIKADLEAVRKRYFEELRAVETSAVAPFLVIVVPLISLPLFSIFYMGRVGFSHVHEAMIGAAFFVVLCVVPMFFALELRDETRMNYRLSLHGIVGSAKVEGHLRHMNRWLKVHRWLRAIIWGVGLTCLAHIVGATVAGRLSFPNAEQVIYSALVMGLACVVGLLQWVFFRPVDWTWKKITADVPASTP